MASKADARPLGGSSGGRGDPGGKRGDRSPSAPEPPASKRPAILKKTIWYRPQYLYLCDGRAPSADYEEAAECCN